MKVQIVGAGAVGLLIGSYFIENGVDVCFIVRNKQQCDMLNTSGIRMIQVDGLEKRYAVEASITWKQEVSLTILTAKFSDLCTMTEQLLSMPVSMPLLFVQNGLSHYEFACSLPQKHIAFASLQFGAQKIDDQTVIHRGIGVVKWAVEKGEIDFFLPFASLNQQQFPLQYEQEAYEMLFEKALLNCFINPLTALLQVKNGALLTNPYAFSILQQLYDELMAAFPFMQQRFPFSFVEQLCEKTANNTSSMLADRLANNRTEVDTIVGAILKKAKMQEKSVPTLQMLYSLIKALEQEGEYE